MLSIAVGLALAAPPLVDGAGAEALVAAGATVLDARKGTAYRRGHIPGAQPVSWRIGVVGGPLSGRLGDPDAVAAELAALGVDAARPVLVVGAWDAGWGEEGRIFWNLEYLGHTDAHLLRGGMSAWPGRTQILRDTPVPGTFRAAPREELRATRDEVASGAFRVLDVREPDEYAGKTPYLEARGGHVPGAASVPWKTLLVHVPAFPTDKPLATYCTGGVRSAMAWALLRDAGFTAAHYDGSWWEWAREVPAE